MALAESSLNLRRFGNGDVERVDRKTRKREAAKPNWMELD